MCIGPFKPKTPATAVDVDFNAVDTDSERLKNKAKGKGGLRNPPKQNALGSDITKGTGLNIPTKPKK